MHKITVKLNYTQQDVDMVFYDAVFTKYYCEEQGILYPHEVI